MGITKNQKAQIDKLTKGNSVAQARIQARVNKLLESKGKRPVMQLAPGGDVQYGSMYDKLAAEQQGQTQPIITQPVEPVAPVPPVSPIPPTSTGATAPQLSTPNNITTTYAIDDPRNPNYVAPAPAPVPADPIVTPPITPQPVPVDPVITPAPPQPEPVPVPPPVLVDGYNPQSGPPEAPELPEGFADFARGFASQNGLTGKAIGFAAMFTSNKFPEDLKDYTVSGGKGSWTANYSDGTVITTGFYNRSSLIDTVENTIPKLVNDFKESEAMKGYAEQTKTYEDKTKSYESFIDNKYKAKNTDPNATVNYQAELDALQNDLAQQSTLITTMPTGVAPPAASEDGVVPEDARTYEEKAQYEANQAALKKYAETQTKTTVAQSNLKNVEVQSGNELMASIQKDPTAMVTKQDVSKLANKVEANQFIDKNTGQVKTKSQAGVTTISGAALSDDPDEVTASEYSADKVTAEAKKELEGVTGAELSGPSQTVTGEQGELGDKAVADEAMKVNEDRILKVKETTDITVAKDQLADFKGKDYEAVRADIAISDSLTAAKAQTDTVKFEELPQPAIIAEENMASAKAMQDAGLAPDAIAVAAKLATFTVSDGTLALAMEGSVQALDTVEGQLSKLMKSFDDGTPSWASGALRAANAALAGRGLGASSMAATAILTAAMESALPIAQQDAQVFNNMNLTNLNNQQQVSLSNAAAQQGLSLTNLSNEQQANLQKSANAFALQTQNLSNRQTVEVSNAQIRATLQGKNLDNTQQSNIAIAARFAEAANINLSNKQQAAMQDSVGALQTNLANLSAKSQSYITSANLAANLQGQVLTNDQQVAITNAARFSEVSNITFSADQQRVLHNSSLMQSIGLAELSTEQSSVLQNAANFAGMDMANLSNLQQAQIENAKNFLNVDLANLTNDQQTVIFKAQATQQALLSDQASQNAALNFNASSENQVNQFNESMKAQVSQFNATQTNAIAQFNAGEMNAVEKFNTQLESDRLKFNAQNSLIVEQANTQWRQNIVTIDTAAENSANAAAAAAANQMTQAAVGEVWQQERDLLDFAFTASESEKDRNNNIIVQKMSSDSTSDALVMKAELEADAQIGAAILNLAFG